MKLSKNPAGKSDSRWITVIFMFLAGLAFIVYGMVYNLNHIDNAYGANYSRSIGILPVIGYLIVVSIPLLYRRWKITAALVVLAALGILWTLVTEYITYG